MRHGLTRRAWSLFWLCPVLAACIAAVAQAGSPSSPPAAAGYQPVPAERFGDARIAAWTREAVAFVAPAAPDPDDAVALWRRLAAVPAQPDVAHARARFCTELAQSIQSGGPPRAVLSGEAWAIAISFAALRRHATHEPPWLRCLAQLCDRLAATPPGDDAMRERDRVEGFWQCRLELAASEPPGPARAARVAEALLAQRRVDVDRQGLVMQADAYRDAARAAKLAEPGRVLVADAAEQARLDHAAQERITFRRLPLVWHIEDGCREGMPGSQPDEDLEIRARERCTGAACGWLRLIACASIVPLEDACRAGEEAHPAPPRATTLANLRRALALPAFTAWSGAVLTQTLGSVASPPARDSSGLLARYAAVRDAAAARFGLQAACVSALDAMP